MINLDYIKSVNPGVFDEVIQRNGYNIQPGQFKDQIVVDIGAHIGTFAYMAREVGQAQGVICLEPNTKNFDHLVNFLGQEFGFSLWKAAISCNNDPVRITDGDNVSEIGGSGELVKAMTLMDVIQMRPQWGSKAVLKMDVEGSEYKALWSSSMSTIRFFNTILLETHGSEQQNIAMNLYLEVLGYTLIKQDRMFRWDVLPDGSTSNWQPLPAWVSCFKIC
jgi:FkbM family methyltransferase